MNYYFKRSLKKKKSSTITNAFQKILRESKRKQNKKRAVKGSEFYTSSMKSWLEKKLFNYVVAERFIRTLKKLNL